MLDKFRLTLEKLIVCCSCDPCRHTNLAENICYRVCLGRSQKLVRSVYVKGPKTLLDPLAHAARRLGNPEELSDSVIKLRLLPGVIQPLQHWVNIKLANKRSVRVIDAAVEK